MSAQLTESYWPADESDQIVNLSVGEMFRQAAAEVPDKSALVSTAPDRPDRAWTYAELLEESQRAAGWLLSEFKPGEHVAVWAPNVPEWVVLQYGAAFAGLVLVTANPALRGAELAHVLNASNAAAIFYVGNFRGSDMEALVNEVLPQTPRVRKTVRLENWLEDVRATEIPSELPEVDPNSATQIQFTSGTTGRSKAAMLRHNAMVTNAAFVRRRCGTSPGATYATSLPMFHTAGCGLAGMGTFLERGTFVLTEVFDPTLALRSIADNQAEAFGGVPAMHHALLAHPELSSFDLTNLKIMMSGGDMVPTAIVDGWEKAAGTKFSSVYGQTEASPIIAQTFPTDDQQTAGQPLPQTEVAILDPHTGETQPLGTEGEICARGYLVMMEYFGQPEATAATIDANGWLHTGDLGTLDANGHLRVTGRLKDLIIRGGENIYPTEIEQELVGHEAVTGAVVIGMPDEQWGETVAAVVQLADGSTRPTASELHDFLRERLAPHKTPKSWYVASELPVNAMGKLQKFRLLEQIQSGELEEL